MSNLLDATLSKFAYKLGGITNLQLLPYETATKMVMHPDEVLIIYQNKPSIILSYCQNGYRVYNSKFEFSYSISKDSTQLDRYAADGDNAIIREFKFGFNSEDSIFIAQQKKGSYFYIQYNKNKSGLVESRILMAVISPVSFEEVVKAKPSNRMQGVVV